MIAQPGQPPTSPLRVRPLGTCIPPRGAIDEAYGLPDPERGGLTYASTAAEKQRELQQPQEESEGERVMRVMMSRGRRDTSGSASTSDVGDGREQDEDVVEVGGVDEFGFSIGPLRNAVSYPLRVSRSTLSSSRAFVPVSSSSASKSELSALLRSCLDKKQEARQRLSELAEDALLQASEISGGGADVVGDGLSMQQLEHAREVPAYGDAALHALLSEDDENQRTVASRSFGVSSTARDNHFASSMPSSLASRLSALSAASSRGMRQSRRSAMLEEKTPKAAAFSSSMPVPSKSVAFSDADSDTGTRSSAGKKFNPYRVSPSASVHVTQGVDTIRLHEWKRISNELRRLRQGSSHAERSSQLEDNPAVAELKSELRRLQFNPLTMDWRKPVGVCSFDDCTLGSEYRCQSCDNREFCDKHFHMFHDLLGHQNHVGQMCRLPKCCQFRSCTEIGEVVCPSCNRCYCQRHHEMVHELLKLYNHNAKSLWELMR